MSFTFVTNGYAEGLVPVWVKNTAKWYGEDLISEAEFLRAIEWLIENKIIILDPADTNPKKEEITPLVGFDKLVELGIEQLNLGDPRDALFYFNEALKKNPDNVKAMVDKGIALAHTGDLANAKALFDQAIKQGEKEGKVSYRAVLNAGIALSIYGDQSDALEYFNRVIDNADIVRQDTLYAALVNKGVVLYELGRYEEAITYYDQALTINPGKLGAIVNKANALQELGKYDEALKWFEKAYAITKDPLAWKPSFIVITE
ncbi:MAG TPA: tetratricopeptide repeat protein [Nitrosopumilaceae archaeon]|nr:tetratricopeptide repeat protein [Nitrosopumilaceae archaeon]